MQPASTTSRAGRAQPLSSSAEPSTTDRRTPRWHRHWRISSTAYNYARRGRGNSGDTAGHSIDREIEDLNAVIAAGGGSAHLFGASTGGALALEAAAAGVAAISVAAYDVPYSVTADAIRFWQTYVAALHTALAEDDRDRALELFMGVAGSPDEEIAQAKASPIWATLRPLAHTLAYDAACLNDGSPPDERLARIRQPVLLITRRPGTAPDVEFFGAAADAAAQAIPSVARQSVSAASHVVDAQVLAPVLADFYRAVVA